MSTGYIPSGNQSWQALKYLLFIEQCLAIAMFDDTYYVYYTKGPYTIQTYTNYRPRPHFESLHPSSCDTSPSPTTPRPILWREMLTWPVEYFGPMEGMGKVFQRWGFFRSRNGESPNMRIGSMWFEATTTTTVGSNHGKIYSWMGENKPTSNLGGVLTAKVPYPHFSCGAHMDPLKLHLLLWDLAHLCSGKQWNSSDFK